MRPSKFIDNVIGLLSNPRIRVLYTSLLPHPDLPTQSFTKLSYNFLNVFKGRIYIYPLFLAGPGTGSQIPYFQRDREPEPGTSRSRFPIFRGTGSQSCFSYRPERGKSVQATNLGGFPWHGPPAVKLLDNRLYIRPLNAKDVLQNAKKKWCFMLHFFKCLLVLLVEYIVLTTFYDLYFNHY